MAQKLKFSIVKKSLENWIFWQTFGFCHSVSSFVCGDNAHPASSVFAPFFSQIQTFRIWAVFRVMQCTQKQDQKEARAIIPNIFSINVPWPFETLHAKSTLDVEKFCGKFAREKLLIFQIFQIIWGENRPKEKELQKCAKTQVDQDLR